MDYDTIDDAFHYVSDAPLGEREAMIQRSTGRAFLVSHKDGLDMRPAGAGTDPDYVTIPHRQDLAPGKALVLEFIRSHCPEEMARAEAIFARSGAFRNVKDLLRRKQLIMSWEIFEGQKVEALLRQWCQEQDLPL